MLAAAGVLTMGASFMVARLVLDRAQRSELADAPRVSISSVPRIEIKPVATPPVSAARPEVPRPSRREAPRETPAAPAPVAAASPAAAPPTPGGTGAVTVVTSPPERTFVYLNGGTLLGETPLRNASVPAGHQKLVLWTPAVGGRSIRMVDVEPGASVLVVEKVRAQQQFSDAGLAGM